VPSFNRVPPTIASLITAPTNSDESQKVYERDREKYTGKNDRTRFLDVELDLIVLCFEFL